MLDRLEQRSDVDVTVGSAAEFGEDQRFDVAGLA